MLPATAHFTRSQFDRKLGALLSEHAPMRVSSSCSAMWVFDRPFFSEPPHGSSRHWQISITRT
jgi:hypothetical protein